MANETSSHILNRCHYPRRHHHIIIIIIIIIVTIENSHSYWFLRWTRATTSCLRFFPSVLYICSIFLRIVIIITIGIIIIIIIIIIILLLSSSSSSISSLFNLFYWVRLKNSSYIKSKVVFCFFRRNNFGAESRTFTSGVKSEIERDHIGGRQEPMSWSMQLPY